MWKLLYQIASPQRFYALTSRWHCWVLVLACGLLFLGGFWGLFWAPPDYQQGDAFRLIYVHVPSAMWSLSIYMGVGGLALALLVWRVKLAGILLLMAAQIGAYLTFVAVVSGSLWGKPMWGTWWIWDARLTSELILLFLYLGILAVGSAYPNQEQGDRMAAILSLVGVVDLPVIHYSVNWWSTLHQGATLSLFAEPKIHPSMAYPLLVMWAGLGLYSLWFIVYTARSELLWREQRQAWVKAVVLQDKT